VSAHRQKAEPELEPETMRLRQRLQSLLARYPGTVLATELTHIHDDQVVVRAALSLADGASVSAHAAEPTDSSGLLDGAIELAEQRATTRALNLLSDGDALAIATREEHGTRPEVDSTIEGGSPPLVVDALRKASLRRRDTVEQPRARAPETELPPSAPPIESGSPESEPFDEPDLADYTWTHFWTWARANDLSTKGQVEQRIGQPIDGLTPRDVRLMLHATGIPL